MKQRQNYSFFISINVIALGGGFCVNGIKFVTLIFATMKDHTYIT